MPPTDRYAIHFEGADDNDGGGIVVLPEEFVYPDAISLGLQLKSANVFVPGYGQPKVGLYSPDGFIYEKQIEGIQTVLLPDLNVVSDWVQLACGITADRSRRTSAAILSFCQHLDIELEPSIACHELAHKNGNPLAFDKLRWMRAADNAEFAIWRDIGLGRTNKLPHTLSKQSIGYIDADLSRPLRRWNRNYIVALKIAEFELSPRSNLGRMLCLLEWMRNDFIVAGPAAVLASIYFAPNSPPRNGLFKSLRSEERRRALLGIQNTAWDITHLSDFLQKVNDSRDDKRRFIFASHDQALLKLATLLFDCSCDGLHVDLLARELSNYWPAKLATRIAQEFEILLGCLEDPSRAAKQPKPAGFVEQLIVQGEAIIASWRPGK